MHDRPGRMHALGEIMAKKNWAWAAAPLVVAGVGLFWLPQYGVQNRAWVFVGVMALLALELAIIGALVNRRPMGAFIDNRNRISLSKLQAGCWTVLVLAAFATAAAYNAVAPASETVTALSIQIPGELLLAMGISATSLAASPMLLSLKANEDAHPDTVQAAATNLGTTLIPNGKVVARQHASDASWADLVTGDEVGNAGAPDLGKIQQVLITLLLLGCYAGYIYMQFAKADNPLTTLPLLDKSFVWLMGISHASYLAYKAAPHTQTDPAPPARAATAPVAPVAPAAPAAPAGQ